MNNNKLIAEFMGYKLARCNNGLAWESPHRKAIDDVFGIHGRLWREDDTKYCWHTDWNWLMEVVQKIESLGYVFIIEGGKAEFGEMVSKTRCFINKNKITSTYTAVVEFIKEYNKD